MRLTKKKAIDISIEDWTHLEETGGNWKDKADWEGWNRYGNTDNDCALCEYAHRHGSGCTRCPYYQSFGSCIDQGSPYDRWCDSESVEERKKYAAECIEQLKELRGVE